MKDVAHSTSDIHKLAIQVGIPDGLAREFRQDFKAFKPIYQEQYWPAHDLEGMAGGHRQVALVNVRRVASREANLPLNKRRLDKNAYWHFSVADIDVSRGLGVWILST